MRRSFNVVASVCVVLISLFTSCTDQGEEMMTYSKPNAGVVRGYENVQSLAHDLDNREDKATDNMTAICTRYTVEDGVRVDSVKLSAQPKMECSIFVEKKEYDITEDQIESKALNTSILRRQNVKDVDGGEAVTDTVVVTVSDGQVVKVPSTITSFRTEEFSYGTVELASATCKSIENVSVVNDDYYTQYTVELVYNEINTKKTYSYTVTLKANATRHLIRNNEIESITAENKQRVVLDDNTERVSFDKVIKMTNGTESRNSFSLVLNREFKGIEAYAKYVSNFAFSFASANGVANGSEAQARTSENWTVYGKTDSYSANIANGVAADAFTTSYTLYHERAEYQDENISVSFGYEDVTVSENKNEVVEMTSDQAGYDKAVYNNGVRTVYIGYTQNLAEEVYLYKQGRAIIGYDFRDGNLVVNDNNVVASVTFVTVYNDGTEETEVMRKSFNRSLVCNSNWTSYQNEGFTQYTHFFKAELASSSAKKDGSWNWTEETRNITNVAEFSVNSTETNSWTAITPNRISVSREGAHYDFGEIAFNAVDETAVVTLANSTDELDTYDYSCKLNVTYGDNTVSSVAPGKILVAKEIKGDFPAEWGKFVSATATVAVNATNDNWVYTWSIHFEKGTLPVVVAQNADNATIDTSLFEYDTNALLNGAVFVDGKWSNSIAEDKNHYMLWSDTFGNAKNAMKYSTATMWNWNNGKNTVFTSAFTFSVENGGKSLKVQKNGADFASYKASTK